MIDPLEFTTEAFTIRCYRPGDGAALTESANASYEHLKPWMSWAVPDQSVEASEKIIRTLAGKYLLREDYSMGIFEGDRHLGGTGFHMRQGPPAWKNTEVGMWIRGDRAGTGLGTAVLSAMLEWAFTEWEFERILWRSDQENLGSIRVAEKNGMRLEATMIGEGAPFEEDGPRRNLLWFAITRADYLASR